MPENRQTTRRSNPDLKADLVRWLDVQALYSDDPQTDTRRGDRRSRKRRKASSAVV